jgi:hypothetical protein
MFRLFKNYFLSIDKCPNILKEFFENPSSDYGCILCMHNQLFFYQAMLMIEGRNMSAIDAVNEINQLQNNLNQKQNALLPMPP